MQHGNQFRFLARVVEPGIQPVSLGMAVKVEDLHDTIPYGLTLEDLFNNITDLFN